MRLPLLPLSMAAFTAAATAAPDDMPTNSPSEDAMRRAVCMASSSVTGGVIVVGNEVRAYSLDCVWPGNAL